MQFIKLFADLPIGKNGNRFRKSINPLSGHNDSKVTANRPTKKKYAFEKSVGIIIAEENVIFFLGQSYIFRNRIVQIQPRRIDQLKQHDSYWLNNIFENIAKGYRVNVSLS